MQAVGRVVYVARALHAAHGAMGVLPYGAALRSISGGAGRMRDILPSGLTDWKGFHVIASDRNFSTDVKADTHDISKLRKMWSDIEECIFARGREASRQLALSSLRSRGL